MRHERSPEDDPGPAAGRATRELPLMRRPDVTVPAIPPNFRSQPVSALSSAELRARAVHYRRMAATATTEAAMRGLLKLAERFDAKADERERGQSASH